MFKIHILFLLCSVVDSLQQYKMEQIIQSQLVSAALQLERQLDSEISRLDNLGGDDIEAIREQRLKDMKKQQVLRQEWKNNVRKYSECRKVKLPHVSFIFFLLLIVTGTR